MAHPGQQRDEDAYNQAWPQVVDNSQEIEGMVAMEQIANMLPEDSRQQIIQQMLSNGQAIQNAVNAYNQSQNASNRNNQEFPQNYDDLDDENEERKGHQRQFTDVVSAALERDDVKGWLSPYMSIFTIGGGLGFASGMVAKKMGKTVMKTGIGAILVIQALHYKGYLTINTDRIKADINSFMQNRENTNYVQFLIANIGPVLAGFGLGFHLG